ncbi:DUF3105 domain-containing protein [Crossiella equi]|nr:DUF3105 domain-containing protein [Crossiella equi]
MVSGKNSRGARASSRVPVSINKPKPWGTIAAVLAVVVFAGGVFGWAYLQNAEQAEKQAALAEYTPSETNKDPSEKISGVIKGKYDAGKHVDATQRVAYDHYPPIGGPHDSVWATCTGVVYPNPVRNENMVHSLEHGAVWLAYNPDQIKGADLDKLKVRAQGQQFTMLSPYPGLDKPISLQAWGRQLKLDSADDPRIDQFVSALRRNQYNYPEVGATCATNAFDPDNAPPFVAEKPGPDAVPMDGGKQATDEQPGGTGQPGGQPGGQGTGQPGGQPGSGQPGGQGGQPNPPAGG